MQSIGGAGLAVAVPLGVTYSRWRSPRLMDAADRYETGLGRSLPAGERVAVGTLLTELHALGRAAHPELDVPLSEFVDALAAHARTEESVVPVLRPEHAADYYLALACAKDVSGAAARLRATELRQIPAYVGSRAPADEVEQLVAIRLLVPAEDGARKIAEYTGKGALGGWIRVVATRIALNLNRRKTPREEGEDWLPFGTVPEVDVSRFRHQNEFKEAFQEALAELSPDDRLLLRMHSIERAKGDDLAKLLGVDRSTVMRRLARAREQLSEGTQRAMMSRLKLSKEEFASLVRDVQSQIDLSLSRLFA